MRTSRIACLALGGIGGDKRCAIAVADPASEQAGCRPAPLALFALPVVGQHCLNLVPQRALDDGWMQRDMHPSLMVDLTDIGRTAQHRVELSA